MIFGLCIAFIASIIIYKTLGFHFALNHDTLNLTYVFNAIIKQQISDGCLPLWNPYHALGSPLLFLGILDLLFIPFLYFLSVLDHMVITGFIYLFAGIYFMWTYLNSEGIQIELSLVGSVLWNFNGFFLFHLHELYFHGALIVIPLLLLSIKNLHEKNKPFTFWTIMIVVNIVQLSTGRLDFVEYTVVLVLLYIIIALEPCQKDVKSDFKARIKLAGMYVASLFLAFCILAPFTFNYIDIIQNSSRSISKPTNYLTIRDFKSIFIPNLFTKYTRYGSYFYVPMIILPFVFISIIRVNRLVIFAIILIGLHYIIAYPTGLWDLVRYLPGHKGAYTVYRTVILSYFGLTILFALGLKEYILNKEEHSRILIISSISIFLLIIVISLRKYYFNGLPGLVYSHHFISLSMFATIFCIIYALTKQASNRKILKWMPLLIIPNIIIIVTIFDINDRSDGDLSQLKSEFFENLRRDYIKKIKTINHKEPLNYRVIFLNGFHPSHHAANMLESINFYHVFPPHIMGLISEKVLNSPKAHNSLINLPRSNPFYSLSSVKYIVSRKSVPYPQKNTGVLIYDDEDVQISINPDAFERIRFLENFIKIESVEEAVDYIAKTPIDWFKKYFIVNEQLTIHNPGNHIRPTYSIKENTPRSIIIQVNASAETMLILNNAYDKGWRLKVNGEDNHIYRVNGYFQGIKIIPGSYEYHLNYLPPNLELYMIISVTSILVALISGLIYKKWFYRVEC